MVKQRREERVSTLEDFERETEPESEVKVKRRFSEVSPTLLAAGLQRVHYKLNGAWCSGKVFENVRHGLPVDGTYNGEQDRLVISVHPTDPRRPIKLKWKRDVQNLDRRFFPTSIRICDLRFLGVNSKGEEVIVQEKDLRRINPPTSSRLMKVATGTQDHTTFEWVDVKKKRGDE